MMRWLVTGANGQVGHHLVRALRAADAQVTAAARADLDITSADAVEAIISTVRPDVVVNLAAYTAVDAAETNESTAALVNGIGPELLATALARSRGRLVQVSTDYVFDPTVSATTVSATTVSATTEHRPYEVDDPVAPRSAYGRTKLAGEQAVRSVLPERSVVLRTAWVYGGPGPNFVDTMLGLAASDRAVINVVDDQIGSPTWAADLGAALAELGDSDQPGVLHYANAGTASWFDLARATFELAGADATRVAPVPSSEFVRPAPRPAWSVLSMRVWIERGLTAPRDWRTALAECLGGKATS